MATENSLATKYHPPVDQLLTYGDCRGLGPWPNYLGLGLTLEHVPELIQMAVDPELNWADPDSLEVWAPVHAWRALGQLRAEEATEPLLSLFHDLEGNEWVGEEFPDVYGMIGPAAIPALAAYLARPADDWWPPTLAAHCLERIGTNHPEARDECVAVLTRQLERFAENDEGLNGFLISYLMNLKAPESLPVIRQAFEAGRVDLFVAGDLEDVEIDLGARAERSSPRPPGPLASLFGSATAAPAAAGKKRKVGRNDPCPCGSGLKYKKCCLNKQA